MSRDLRTMFSLQAEEGVVMVLIATESQIKILVEYWQNISDTDTLTMRTTKYTILSLILAWAEATARAERADHSLDSCEQCGNAYHDKDRCEKYRWTPADWRNAVLSRIGWKD